MPTYENEEQGITREELEKIRKSHRCTVCGGWLNMFLDNDPNSDKHGLAFVACADWPRTHHDGIAKEYQEPRPLNIPAWREKMEKEHGKQTATALEKYHPSEGQLTQAAAMHILKLVYPHAPEDEIIRCAILCRDFGLHPLKKEVYLIPFKNKKTGKDEYATVVGIAADRKMAADRKGAYSFLDNSPRAATPEEITKQFGKDSEEAEKNLISICMVKGESGNQALGFGLWPKDSEPYGTEKGNTKRNMANIRSERQAVSRLPGKPLPPVQVIDEAYAELPDNVDTKTGEIIEGTATEVTEPEPGGRQEPEPEKPQEPEPQLGKLPDLLNECPEHGDKWRLNRFSKRYHAMPDGTSFCNFNNQIKPYATQAAKQAGMSDAALKEWLANNYEGKSWSKLTEEEQVGVITRLSAGEEPIQADPKF